MRGRIREKNRERKSERKNERVEERELETERERETFLSQQEKNELNHQLLSQNQIIL